MFSYQRAAGKTTNTSTHCDSTCVHLLMMTDRGVTEEADGTQFLIQQAEKDYCKLEHVVQKYSYTRLNFKKSTTVLDIRYFFFHGQRLSLNNLKLSPNSCLRCLSLWTKTSAKRKL